MDDYELFVKEYTTLCEYNPPLAVQDPSTLGPPKLGKPISFCDKHPDQSLVLRRINPCPALLTGIANTADASVENLRQAGQRLPPIGPTHYFPRQGYLHRESLSLSRRATDAAGVAERYAKTIGMSCPHIASTLVLHPYTPEWCSTIYFNCSSATQPSLTMREEDYPTPYIDQHGNLTLTPISRSSLNVATLETLEQIAERFPELAVWLMLTPDAENALRDMDKWMDSATYDFYHERCHTSGFNPPNTVISRPVDASTTGWDTTMASFVSSLTSSPLKSRKRQRVTNSTDPVRRSERLGKSKAETNLPRSGMRNLGVPQRRKWNTVTLPPEGRSSNGTNSRRNGIDDSLAASLIQCAWSLAVRRDSTFIVFHCGNYERIGFRHRQSQTLFLSDLIDVSKCENPAYGKLHIGLHICILKDVVDRIALIRASEDMRLNGPGRGKRKHGDILTMPDGSRPRTRSRQTEETKKRKERETYEMVSIEMASRDLALLRIQYDGYNSIAPAGMMRVGQSLCNGFVEDWKKPSTLNRYKPHQYFILTITSEIAEGAIGTAYRGTVEVLTAERNVATVDIVVKLAFEAKEQERMRHEYNIYDHLASAHIKGVPVVHGLFEDVESGVVGLVMEDVGDAIVLRMDPHGASNFPTTDVERAGFIQTLKDIHKAGVRHRDLRAENLTVDKYGDTYIIDFDRAKVSRKKKARREEVELLEDFFEGVYPEYNWTGDERSTDADTAGGDAD